MEANVNVELASAAEKSGSVAGQNVPANPRLIEWRCPGDLRAHPHWVKPLDSPEVEAVKNDVLERGVIDVPLHVLSDGTILDGHVRWTWAQVKKVALVPVLVFPELDSDEAAQIRHMISASKRRIFLEVDLVLLALRLWEVLAEEGKANQKTAGRAGAARRHGLDGPEPPPKKVNARNDAARAIGRSPAFLANARTLHRAYADCQAPAWLLYSASVGVQQVLPLEKAYDLARNVPVEAQQALVDEILALPEEERRTQARLRTNEILKLAASSEEATPSAVDGAELGIAESLAKPAAQAEIASVAAGEPAKADLAVRREARAAGEFASLLGAVLGQIEAKGLDVLVRQLRLLRGRGDPDADILRRLHAELGKLLAAAEQPSEVGAPERSATSERAA